MGRSLATILLLTSSASLASSLIDVWPTKVQPRADGRVSYVYDLAPLKTPERLEALTADLDNPEAARAFIEGLPKQVRVLANLKQASYQLTGSDSLVPGPLAATFSEVVLPPELQTSPTKLLPSADALIWKGQRALDGMTAAILLAVEEGKWGLPLAGQRFWDAVLVEAMERTRLGSEEHRAGALLLAARLGASRCDDRAPLPRSLVENEALQRAIERERSEGNAEVLPLLPSELDGWTPALECLAERERRLGLPLPLSRVGVFAVLHLLAILEENPKLAATHAGLSSVRDALAGEEPHDELQRFRKSLEGQRAESVLGNFSGFIDRLASDGVRLDGALRGPAIFLRSRTPVQRFVAQLQGGERHHALDEAALAATDGRLSLEPKGDAAPEVWRSAALAPLLEPRLPDAPDALSTDLGYRSRLQQSFRALQGAPIEATTGELPRMDEGEGKSARPKVRLRVPPSLDIEPVPEAYARLGRAFARMQSLLRKSKHGSALYGIYPGGARRSQPAGVEAARLQALYGGLSKLALRAVGITAQKAREEIALEAASSWLKGWQRDPDLRQDVRWVLPRSGGAKNADFVGGAFGVGLRWIGVSFEKKPKLELEMAAEGAPAAFELDATATQPYLIPVLVTSSVPGATAISRATFQKLADGAGRELLGIERALEKEAKK